MTKARGDQPDTSAELSEAARAAVRDPGDPRIDAHLAALGLGPDPASPASSAPVARPRAPRAESAEVDAIRAQVAELERALGAARLRVRRLGVALVVALMALAATVLLLVTAVR